MKFEILFKLPILMRQVDDIPTPCQPIVCLDLEWGQLGFGLELPPGNKFSIWSHIEYTKLIIQIWRAMILMERLPNIERPKLGILYEIMERKLTKNKLPSDWRRMFEILPPKQFKALRKELLQMAPTYKDLEKALLILKAKKIKLSLEELSEEISLGNIIPPLCLEKVLKPKVKKSKKNS